MIKIYEKKHHFFISYKWMQTLGIEVFIEIKK